MTKFALFNKIAENSKTIVVTIHYVEQNFKTTKTVDPSKKIKHLYPLISLRVKV